MTPTAVASTEAIWGPIARAGMAFLGEYSVEQLLFLLEFLGRGRELHEREEPRIHRVATEAENWLLAGSVAVPSLEALRHSQGPARTSPGPPVTGAGM